MIGLFFKRKLHVYCIYLTRCAQLLSHIQLFGAPWTIPTRLLCPWNSPGKNTGVRCHYLLQGFSPTQILKPHLLHLLIWQVDSLPLSLPGKHIYILSLSIYIYIYICIYTHTYIYIYTHTCINASFYYYY